MPALLVTTLGLVDSPRSGALKSARTRGIGRPGWTSFVWRSGLDIIIEVVDAYGDLCSSPEFP